VVRPLVAAPRPEPVFFVGAFRAVDLVVDLRALARFVDVLLVDDFFAEAFFVELDFGGLA
jgi:hypothetical protein